MTPLLLLALLVPSAPATRDARLGLDWKKVLQPGCSANGNAQLGGNTFFSVSCERSSERLSGHYLASRGRLERLLECDGALDLVVAGDTLYFLRHLDETGYELWATGGTRKSTRLVKDINPGPRSSNPQHLVALGARVVFQADDGVHGRELWASDGTEKGTVLVKDLLAGPGEGQPTLYPGAEGLVYFSAIAGPKRTGWWKTDGTADGTVLLQETAEKLRLEPGDEKYWSAGFRLWRDEAKHTWLMHKELPPSTWRKVKDLGVAERVTGVTAAGARTYFALHEGVATTLWVSDGTADGTRPLASLPCGEGCRAPGVTGFSGCGHDLFVIDSPFNDGATAWASDGTREGTRAIVSGLTDGTVEGTWPVWELEPPKQQ